jgi:hypothetical protein
MTFHESSLRKQGPITTGALIVEEAVYPKCTNERPRRMVPAFAGTTRGYGFKIDAPVVARLSRSICALAASFSA